MTPVNAISKVRFSAAKAQRIHLQEDQPVCSQLLCLESGQSIDVPKSTDMLYVISGRAGVVCDGNKTELGANYLISPGNDFSVSNETEQRLVCLAIIRS